MEEDAPSGTPSEVPEAPLLARALLVGWGCSAPGLDEIRPDLGSGFDIELEIVTIKAGKSDLKRIRGYDGERWARQQ